MFVIMNEDSTEFHCRSEITGFAAWMTRNELMAQMDDMSDEWRRVTFKTKLEALQYCEATPGVGYNVIEIK